MATISGKQGKVTVRIGDEVTASYLVKMRSWEFESSVDIEDAAYFGGSAIDEGYKEKTPTALDWNMSCEGDADSGDTITPALYEAQTSNTLVEMTLYMNANRGIRGQGYIDSFSVSDSADGKVEVSLSLAGNGEANFFTTPPA